MSEPRDEFTKLPKPDIKKMDGALKSARSGAAKATSDLTENIKDKDKGKP